ncbi:MAG: hypothetical protein KF795_02325 [Labilithrix sp.]|nr:hypothetical protein [Labilithrix sp.]
MKRPRSLAFAVAVCAFACVPKLADDQALVRGPRVLAVRATPAEAKPGLAVTLTALVAAPAGSASPDGLEWAMCLARKPLTELGPVAEECVERFGQGGEDFLRLGRGPVVTGTVPADACRRFGPLAPPAAAGGVAGRPVDPDLSGGYHQPIVLGSEAGTALASVRLACGVVGVPNAESIRYGQGYRPNENPEIERVEIVSGDPRVIAPGLESPGAKVPPSARVELRVSWAACPREPVCGDGLCTAGENQKSCAADCRDEPRGCTGAETYLWANPATRNVEARREGVRVSWFSTAGVFAEEQTGRVEEDADGTDTSNEWTAPSERGPVRMWIVIRDDRGGVGWRELVVEVE